MKLFVFLALIIITITSSDYNLNQRKETAKTNVPDSLAWVILKEHLGDTVSLLTSHWEAGGSLKNQLISRAMRKKN